MKRPRRNHAAAFMAKIELAAIKGDKTLPGLAGHFDVHPNRITHWKSQLLERVMGIFATAAEKSGEAVPNAKDCAPKLSNWRWRTIL
jgi:transposase